MWLVQALFLNSLFGRWYDVRDRESKEVRGCRYADQKVAWAFNVYWLCTSYETKIEAVSCQGVVTDEDVGFTVDTKINYYLPKLAHVERETIHLLLSTSLLSTLLLSTLNVQEHVRRRIGHERNKRQLVYEKQII